VAPADQGFISYKERRLLSILNKQKLEGVLAYMLDENEFLGPTAFARCRGITRTIRSSFTSVVRRSSWTCSGVSRPKTSNWTSGDSSTGP
jgi:hypothetical protein